MQDRTEFMKDKVALITGAAGDIGMAICKRLVKDGVRLVITDWDGEELKKSKQILTEIGGTVEAIQGNLEDVEFCRSLPHFAVDTYEALDILINNAGQAHHSAIEEITPEVYQSIMNVNVRAPFFVTQEALPYLRISDAATVINIGSVTAHKGYKDQSVFTISKHALLGLTKSLALETFNDGIRVHIISPGAVYTNMIDILRPDLPPEDLIQPDDIADLIVFYLERRNSSFVIDEVRIHRTHKAPF